MPKKLYAELFDPMRALGSFASKITMAYALNIITRDIYSDLETIRKIRNAFAHSPDILNFESKSIAPLLDRLKKSVHAKADRPDLQFLECVTPIDEALDAYLKSKARKRHRRETDATGQ
jgi:DNA-binding MltR family transcriptional regulator